MFMELIGFNNDYSVAIVTVKDFRLHNNLNTDLLLFALGEKEDSLLVTREPDYWYWVE